MNQIFVLGTLVVTVFMGGCTTTSVPLAQAKPVPKERIFAYQENIPEPHGTLIVTRDKGLTGSACLIDLVIDFKTAAKLDTAETVNFILPTGMHSIEATTGNTNTGICSLSPVYSGLDLSIHNDETKMYRIVSELYGGLRLIRVAE